MLAIYLILLFFLLILFVFLTAIVLTFKLKVLSLEDKKELGGTFTVKWLFFSRTFVIEEPGEKKSLFGEPDEAEKETKVETESPQGKKEPEQTRSEENTLSGAEHKVQEEEVRVSEEEVRISGEKVRISEEEVRIPREEKPEEKTVIPEVKERIEVKEKTQVEKKKGIFDRIRGKKRGVEEGKVEAREGMTTREKLHWGMEAYKALRKPLFRLFSDMLNAIKIKNLKADLTFGLSDPADTGMLCGFIHALLGTVYNRCRNCSFSVSPVFMESLLDFQGSAEIRVKIYSLIFPFFKFIFNGKTLSFTYSIVKAKLRGSSKINS